MGKQTRYGAEALAEKLNGQKGLSSQVFSSDCHRFPGRVTISIVVPNYDLSKAHYEVSYTRYEYGENGGIDFQKHLSLCLKQSNTLN